MSVDSASFGCPYCRGTAPRPGVVCLYCGTTSSDVALLTHAETRSEIPPAPFSSKETVTALLEQAELWETPPPPSKSGAWKRWLGRSRK